MEFRTLKLCSVRGLNGHLSLTPAGMPVEIEDQENIDALLELGAIEPIGAADEGEPVVKDGLPGDLDADAFVAWVAAGAKVGQVTDWIGTDLDRAQLAEADKRPTVQKHIDRLVAGDAEPVKGDPENDPATDEAALADGEA